MMKVEIISKETIKPSFPTPIHQKIYKLSVFDQVAPSTYSSLVLIYQNANDDYGRVCQTLKNSLSDTLTLFPPLAGRIKDNVSVDCNDSGVVCYETRARITLGKLLLADQVYENLTRLVVAGDDDDDMNANTGAQLLVQINLFNCGGIALGLSFSHKICDAASFATFLKSWSARAINSGQLIAPDLTVSTIFPPRGDLSVIRPLIPPSANDLTTARLIFDGPKIAALKAESASQSTPQPTRVEAVTALIVKCALAASNANRKEEDHFAPYMVIHPVNIRGKLTPPLSEYAFGNVFGAYNTYSQQSETSLEMLVDELRKARTGYCDSAAANGEKTASDYVDMWERAPELMLQGGSVIQIYAFTSWCRFGFYQADFGFGKPMWVGVPGFHYKNHAVLLDTRDENGVEAYVHLEKQDMALFLADHLLLHYASVYPAASDDI